jgi:phosphoribosylanthranilate isomerase
MSMNRTRIKICGVCRPEDAELAARAGADAVGIPLYERAPRYVEPALARQIIAALPPFVTPVGIFVDASPEDVLRRAHELGLRHVQFNGHESPQDVRAVSPLMVIKAIRVDRSTFVNVLNEWREAIRSTGLANLAGFVLETAGTNQPGGTGVENDWAAIRDAKGSGAFEGLPPVIAAGGLNPNNVADVVRAVRPYAVDVSSGVEAALRQKSADKVIAFVAAVRRADAD